MARKKQRASMAQPKASLYGEITAHIVADLEEGIFPWARPWGADGNNHAFSLPRNAATGKAYSGINILILWGKLFESGFSSQRWLTFNQASSLGASVRKGEHGVTVCYADRFIPKRSQDGAQRSPQSEADEAEAAIPLLRRYTVFNIDQCERLPEHLRTEAPAAEERQIVPQAEALAAATLADIRVGGSEAFYAPSTDSVHIPPQPAFFEQINFYRTLFHELGHWTGHESRLNRDLSGPFGSKPYAKEELVAELTAAFICAALTIKPTVRHADYLGSWLNVLREDSRAIFQAASKASKAADFLFAFSPNHPAAAVKARAPEAGFSMSCALLSS